MAKKNCFNLSTDEVRYRSLLERMKNECISSATAIKIVGGKKRLFKFIENGTIRAEKPEGKRNMQWRINAADCYRCVKPNKMVAGF